MKQNNNLFRPQVYFQRKEEIELIKEDFIKNGNNNKSQYFHDLIILGLKTKNERKDDDHSSILDGIDFKIDALLNGLETMNEASFTKEEKEDLFKRLKQLSFDLAQIKNKLNDMDNRLAIQEKALANIYQFTYKFGNRKCIENGEYDKLPERFYR